jgi:hypothetical protein
MFHYFYLCSEHNPCFFYRKARETPAVQKLLYKKEDHVQWNNRVFDLEQGKKEKNYLVDKAKKLILFSFT